MPTLQAVPEPDGRGLRAKWSRALVERRRGHRRDALRAQLHGCVLCHGPSPFARIVPLGLTGHVGRRRREAAAQGYGVWQVPLRLTAIAVYAQRRRRRSAARGGSLRRWLRPACSSARKAGRASDQTPPLLPAVGDPVGSDGVVLYASVRVRRSRRTSCGSCSRKRAAVDPLPTRMLQAFRGTAAKRSSSVRSSPMARMNDLRLKGATR